MTASAQGLLLWALGPVCLYRYFPNKESLVVALLERHVKPTLRVGFAELRRAASLPLRDAVRLRVDFMLAATGQLPVLVRRAVH